MTVERKNLADNFIGLYPVSKTLRFKLEPVGRTLEHIQREGLLDTDLHRAESYVKAKKIIDRYHKAFIEESLKGLALEGLQEYEELYLKSGKDEKEEKVFQNIQAGLRKQIVKRFKEHPKYKNLLKGELIEKDILDFLREHPDDLEIIKEFTNFTTYFEGFHSNRENMYSEEAKSTSVAYRTIHQNLPRYIDNMRVFEQIRECEINKELPMLLEQLHEKCEIESIDSFFTLEGFSAVITQKGIDTYNAILGAFSEKDGVKIKGLNEYINLYNQKLGKGDRKIPKLKPLYKQILSDREKLSFVPEQFATDSEVLVAVREAYEYLRREALGTENGMNLQELLEKISSYDLDHIYIANDSSITDIAQYLLSDWAVIRHAIEAEYDKKHVLKKKAGITEKYEEVKKKTLGRNRCYSIKFLQEVTEEYRGERIDISRYFSERMTQSVQDLDKRYKECGELWEAEDTGKSTLSKDQKAVEKIKNLLDAMLELERLLKPFLAGQNEAQKDEMFYGELLRISDTLKIIVPIYNKVRNYITKKPYSLEKIKLNFNKSTLLNGWDKNKEKDNLGIIFQKDGLYYLGIMNRDHNKVIDEAPIAETDNIYRKMEYKLLPGPNKMLPKVFFSKSRIDEFAPGEEILEKYEKGTHKKGEDFSINDCRNLIDFFKGALKEHADWAEFDFKFSNTETYEDISGFYKEVEHQGYKIVFRDIDATYIDQLVENGQLYLFQISGKDFSPHSKGKPNLHTMYWKMLFDPENLKDVVYKLNGQAEIFYRRQSIEEQDIVRHAANVPIANKAPDASKKSSTFPYELVKDRRFTVDQFQFHVPITMNFKAAGISSISLNREVNHCIHDGENIHVIGIDRGERNLLYLTVVDTQGNIKEQMSLNTILSYNKNMEAHSVDYHQLLDKREKDNKAARQNWQTINTIKDLKEGYLSQVVHIVAQLMLKYNAIVVLEDLNIGFKRGRQKVEKQVYQKFEKMLIEKLNYLVEKDKAADENGGLLHAYQLTSKFESFQRMGKQSGFLYYVPAWNTSKIDPTTGFTNLFYTKYETVEKTKEFIQKFDSITYNQKSGYFEFAFDYSNFTYKAEGSRTVWTVCSYGERIENFRNSEKNSEWDVRHVDLTQAFIELFERNGIDWQKGDIRLPLCGVEGADFYKEFLHKVSLMLQMRNSDPNTGEDKIISPVQNSRGEFFESSCERPEYPIDADANGAYNIARKGLWIVEQIKEADLLQQDKVKLAISNKEWLIYAQEHVL